MNKKNLIKYKTYYLFKKESGFSIVEMLLVVFIIAIVATVISLLYISSVRSQKDLLDKAGSEANLRTTMYSIAKDIREIGDRKEDGSPNEVIAARSDYIKFLKGTAADIVEYELSSSNGTYTLNKKITSGGTTTTKFIMGDITSNSIFNYYTTSDSAAIPVPLSEADLSVFKLVKLNFIVNKKPLETAKALNLSTMVSIRNR
ncbi:MAG: PulJ/GspJ family protein [Candidatus Humimicrobiaceae bacterium]